VNEDLHTALVFKGKVMMGLLFNLPHGMAQSARKLLEIKFPKNDKPIWLSVGK
jgi:hypothetical protein